MNTFIKASILLLISTSVFAKSDELCLAEAIYYEAKGESDNGKAAIYSVVKNRSKKSGKRFCEVIYERNQFSWTKKRKLQKVPLEFIELSKKLINNGIKDITNGSTYFCFKGIMKKFKRQNKLKLSIIIGNHAFFIGDYS